MTALEEMPTTWISIYALKPNGDGGMVTPMVEVHEGQCVFRHGIHDDAEGTDSTHLMLYVKQAMHRQIKISKPCCMLESFSPQIKSANVAFTVVA